MRRFILFSRRGQTDGRFSSLREAGRLDLVYQCALMALFKAHAVRRDVVFDAILGGPPRPPLHLRVDGASLRDARIDERTWEGMLRAVLSGKERPGLSVARESLQGLTRGLDNLFVLHERGVDAAEVDFGADPAFVLGDQVGLPKKDERYLLRTGTKISLGRTSYLAASCIGVLNYLMDRREEGRTFSDPSPAPG